MKYPPIIAHRCGGALAPENSLEGLRIAARLGCQGVEFDVMLSADGVPLLIHDETLDRTTTGSGQVAQMSAAAIRQFDAGSPHHPAFAVSPAPTFEEAMACCRELGLWPNIEIKPAAGHESATGEIVADWLARHWDGAGIVSSFSPDALAAARRKGSKLAFALLLTALPSDWKNQMHELGATALHLAGNKITIEDAAALKETPWACYTINRRADADQLFALSCQAIITDRPDLWSPAEMSFV